MLLRGCAVHETDSLTAPFDALRLACAHHGLVISRPSMRQASGDEILLLGWLSKLQRRYSILPDSVPDALLPALNACAAQLRNADIRLPQRGLGHANLPSTSDRAAEPLPDWKASRPRPHLSAARTRAWGLIRDREVISASDFVASGISRQCISNWCREGHLERISSGWYRARPSLAAAHS